MEGPTFDVLGFLTEPRHPASVATVTGRGRPALAMIWFLLEDDRLWFHTAEPPGLPAPFLRAARERAEVAVMVATFNPPADVRQVRMTGPARVEERDDTRVRRLYLRYVDAWAPKWERQATTATTTRATRSQGEEPALRTSHRLGRRPRDSPGDWSRLLRRAPDAWHLDLFSI